MRLRRKQAGRKSGSGAQRKTLLQRDAAGRGTVGIVSKARRLIRAESANPALARRYRNADDLIRGNWTSHDIHDGEAIAGFGAGLRRTPEYLVQVTSGVGIGGSSRGRSGKLAQAAGVTDLRIRK